MRRLVSVVAFVQFLADASLGSTGASSTTSWLSTEDVGCKMASIEVGRGCVPWLSELKLVKSGRGGMLTLTYRAETSMSVSYLRRCGGGPSICMCIMPG